MAAKAGGGGGGMSLEARKKKKERFIERAKRLRFIKAKALKKMGGRVMKPQQAELGSSSSPDPDGRDGGTKRQETKRQGIPSTRKDQKRGEKPTSSTSRERNSKHDDKRNTTTSSTMKKKMKKFASEGPSKDELVQKANLHKVKERKSSKTKLMYKKTRRGQPVMRHKIEDILSKIC